MGTITKGILGGFSGKVGTVIGGNWKGIEYMRSRPAPRNFDPSPLQKDQQAKFGMTVGFLQSISEVINVGFKNFAVRKSAYNSALSYTLGNAITGKSPDFAIDYPLVRISRGDLHGALEPAAIAEAGSLLKFTWGNNSGMGKAKATDGVILLAYCPARKQAMSSIGASTREGGSQYFGLDAFAGQKVHTWIGMVSADGQEVSDSQYLGELTIG